MRKTLQFNSFNTERTNIRGVTRFFEKIGINELNSFCQRGVTDYSKKSKEVGEKFKV